MQTLAKRKAPAAADKQIMRQWGEEVGIKGLDAEDPAVISHVQSLVPPKEILLRTRRVYRDLVPNITLHSLEDYSEHMLGIDIPR